MKYLLLILFIITYSCQDKNIQIINRHTISDNSDSLLHYYNLYKTEPNINSQTDYIKCFPKNFTEFYDTFGWNEINDKPTPLYNTSYEYIDTYFKIIRKSKNYDIALKLCVNGFWQADGVNYLQANMLELLEKDTSGILTYLKKYTYNEQKSIWTFLLDAPYKKNNVVSLLHRLKTTDIQSYHLAYTLWNKKLIYEKNNLTSITLDSLITDINNDNINDKILIKGNRDENTVFGDDYFKNIDQYRRTINIIVSTNKNKHVEITNNDKLIPCLRCNEPMDSYSDFQLIDPQTLSIKIVQKANKNIFKLLFSWEENNFYLSEIQVSEFFDNKVRRYKISKRICIDKFDYDNIFDYIQNTYTIQGPDGCTNLRQKKSASSEILQKIKSGEPVEIMDNSGDWILVKTREGKEGYVHYSRIRPE